MSNLIHPFAVTAAFYIGGIFDAEFIFGLGTVFYFVGREITQAEYRWIEWYGYGQRKNLPWYGALDERVWDTHSFFWNLVLPATLFVLLSWIS